MTASPSPTDTPAPSVSNSNRSEWLIAYFRSGWAFLIPYLATYLLYTWLKWPANPPAGNDQPLPGIGGYWIPSLLHVYWFLHGTHVLLGLVALRTWWCKSYATVGGATDNGNETADGATRSQATMMPHSDNRPKPDRSPRPSLGEGESAAHRLKSTAYRLARLFHPQNDNGPHSVYWSRSAPAAVDERTTARAPWLHEISGLVPWLLLALIFWIPGVYLEWPADPWEHLRRINEWHAHGLVTEHSAWMKSSYFIPYSMLGWAVGFRQIFWLDFYHVGICLLLCWQYYRLARVCDLGERAAMVFVIAQVLLLGNSTFSFYRYYSISSSIYAQIGAVALTRIALELAKGRSGLAGRHLFPGGFSVACLFLLVAYNHPQGIGIAALGIGAIAVWRLIQWKTIALGWIAALILAANLLFLWLYPRPEIIESYRNWGFLNAWYGFNILNLFSPAGDRMMQIINAVGLLNLAAAALLVFRNRVVAWLTLMPLATLLMPLVAVPLVQALAAKGGAANVVTFQRMLFAVPPCLAFACLFSEWRSIWVAKRSKRIETTSSATAPNECSPGFAFTCAAMIALMIVPGSSVSFNRMWNTLAVIPDDLQLRHFVGHWTPERAVQAKDENILVINTPLAAEMQELFLPSPDWAAFRPVYTPFDNSHIERRMAWLDSLSVASTWTQSSKINDSTIQPDRVLLIRSDTHASSSPVIESLTATNDTWLQLGGIAAAEQEISHGRLILKNPAGKESNPFNPDLIPVSRHKRYQLTSTIRQSGDPDAINYLAVVWYDRDANMLTSYLPPPQGAGNPRGWQNGTYSYYGLAGQPAGSHWTNYSVSFGFSESVDVPANAVYLRAGALLNYHATVKATVELTDVILTEKPAYRRLLFVAPEFRNLTTPASIAASLSRHWGPQHVGMDHAGTDELRRRFFAITTEERGKEPKSP